MNKKIFLFRQIGNLSLKHRFLQNLMMVGIPFFLLGVFIPVSDLGWEVEVPLSLLGGVLVSICVALAEHAFFRLRKPND